MNTVVKPFHIRIGSWLPVVVLATALAACSGGDKPASKEDAASTVATAEQSPGLQAYTTCATCHQANGEGLPSAFPPLAGGEFATHANPTIPIMIVIYGLQGPVTAKGQEFNGIMPAYGTGIAMEDADVAAVLTYVRSSWGNTASAITAEDVAKVRAIPRTATGPVTAAELEAIK